MDFFYEKRDFFNLKELEKMLPKEKGIVQQTVKDVVQSLVDDHLVTVEKIGTSNYFWSFPSTALITRRNQLDTLNAEIARLERQALELEEAIREAGRGREDTPHRRELSEQVSLLEAQMADAKGKFEAIRHLDPALIAEKRRTLQQAQAGLERWTDNILTIQSFCCNQFGMSKTDFNQQFGIDFED